MRERDILDFSSFLDELQSETDRGAALVGAALIDQRLSDTLKAFMVTSDAANRLLDGGMAPLGTLSARINAAFALGLIGEHELSECTLIRKVRNEFAHSIHGTTFADPKISSFCAQLKSDLPGGREAFAGKPRDVFLNAVTLVVLGLTYRAEYVAKERRTIRPWP